MPEVFSFQLPIGLLYGNKAITYIRIPLFGLIFWNFEIRLCLLVKEPASVAADLDFSHPAYQVE
jgi:hypothetical protein